MPASETFHGFIESTTDTLLIFEACRRGILPKINRRLQERERGTVRSGTVFVFDERESGIKRWTDGLVWSPSRILGNFLIYRELDSREAVHDKRRSANQRGSSAYNYRQINQGSGDADPETEDGVSDRTRERALVGSLVNSYKFKKGGLIKKTMSIVVNGSTQHLISYYMKEDVLNARLPTPSSVPELACLEISPDLLLRQSFRIPPMVENNEFFKHSKQVKRQSLSSTSSSPPPVHPSALGMTSYDKVMHIHRNSEPHYRRASEHPELATSPRKMSRMSIDHHYMSGSTMRTPAFGCAVDSQAYSQYTDFREMMPAQVATTNGNGADNQREQFSTVARYPTPELIRSIASTASTASSSTGYTMTQYSPSVNSTLLLNVPPYGDIPSSVPSPPTSFSPSKQFPVEACQPISPSSSNALDMSMQDPSCESPVFQRLHPCAQQQQQQTQQSHQQSQRKDFVFPTKAKSMDTSPPLSPFEMSRPGHMRDSTYEHQQQQQQQLYPSPAISHQMSHNACLGYPAQRKGEPSEPDFLRTGETEPPARMQSFQNVQVTRTDYLGLPSKAVSSGLDFFTPQPTAAVDMSEKGKMVSVNRMPHSSPEKRSFHHTLSQTQPPPMASPKDIHPLHLSNELGYY